MAPGTELGSPVPQSVDSANASNRESSQHTNTPPDPKIGEQRLSEEDGSGRQGGSKEVVAGEQTRCILRVGQRDVEEHTLKLPCY